MVNIVQSWSGYLAQILFVLVVPGLALAELYTHRLQAAQVLPANLLEGPNYSIDPQVLSDGLVNTYRLQTKYGVLTVDGTPLLIERLNELRALDRIEKLEKSEVYQKALKEGVKTPLKGAESLIDDPLVSLKRAAQGVGRWMTDIGRSISSNDPHQAGVAETTFGQAAAKRAFAYDFGVDPYTRFKPLQKSLDNLGWAIAGGGLTSKLAFSLIPGMAGVVISATGTTDSMKALVRDKSPAQLETINREKLHQMGVDEATTAAFLANQHLTPQDKSIIVGELATLKGAKGRAAFIAASAMAEDEGMALFMRYRAQMIGNFQSKKGGIDSLVKIDRSLFVKTTTGEFVGLFPIDRIPYDSEMKEKLDVLDREISKQPEVRGKQLWIGGPVEMEARSLLKRQGWTVHDRLFDDSLLLATKA
jgi:hypothetical protein